DTVACSRSGENSPYGILEGAQETWTMVGLGTRFTLERVRAGNSQSAVARAWALLDRRRLGMSSLRNCTETDQRQVSSVSGVLRPVPLILYCLSQSSVTSLSRTSRKRGRRLRFGMSQPMTLAIVASSPL